MTVPKRTPGVHELPYDNSLLVLLGVWAAARNLNQPLLQSVYRMLQIRRKAKEGLPSRGKQP